MRPHIAITTALLASSAAAAPTPAPGLIGDIFNAVNQVLGTVIDDTTANLNNLLKQIGIVLHTNAGSSHGQITQYHDQCPFNIIE